MKLRLTRFGQSWTQLEILNEVSYLFPEVLTDSEDV
jgi:hypothetical protein